ncbi:glycosyltransferase family 4 protein [Hankyongella ginsenosidimutans]|uniref:Glycosyltransferase family 4 protein n=2 Tax=Hankyongella ginsenosidimutans TaxID=1763828 RepID=A0A4D7CB99_9SPHN|nr:glycosyltransferase family 4 protein [Hankyongella ginsenosidimutans]
MIVIRSSGWHKHRCSQCIHFGEGCPTAILEAMSYGTPVVSYATGGIPEIVDHGRDGLLVPPKDTVEMAAAILRLLRDRKRLHPTD